VVENPFFHRGPIKQSEYFYGRTRETARALQLLKNGQSISVVGSRKIGKTSLLLHLMDPQVCTEHGLNSNQHLFAYIGCETLGRLGKLDIYRVMLEEISHQLALRGTGLAPTAIDWENLQFHQFNRVVRELTGRGLKLIFLLDEFECLGNNHRLDADFFSSLRSLTLHNLAYVTASQDPLLELTIRGEILSSPFFNIFAFLKLGLFSTEEATLLVERPSRAMGVQFPQQMVGFLLEFVGLHPFYLQVASYHAFELAMQKRGFDEQDKRDLAEEILTDLADHFAYHLDRLDKDEKRALARLCKVGVSELPFDIGRKLEQRCLIVRQNGGYGCLSQAFEGFVRLRLAASWEKTIAEGDRRLATILFADLVDFMPMAESQRPEEVMHLMRQVTKLFSDPVERHGGVVIQFRGDGILALFGIPVERKDDAVRAVLASLDMQRNLEQFNQQMVAEQRMDLAARIGLNTGIVVIGEMGSDQHVEHTAMGDAVNLAERMQRAAQPGGIVISEHTYQQVRRQFKVKAMGPISVKGRARQVKAYCVDSAS